MTESVERMNLSYSVFCFCSQGASQVVIDSTPQGVCVCTDMSCLDHLLAVECCGFLWIVRDLSCFWD